MLESGNKGLGDDSILTEDRKETTGNVFIVDESFDSY
jgi:hypothetical protein